MGTIFTTNITPSATAGIGQYTEEQFARAVRAGVRADGANLYPAMPYTSYNVLTDADIHDLYTYFQHGVAPVDTAPTRTALPFPMNIRLSMMAWNLLFLGSGDSKTDAAQSPEWNRGKYLVEGPAHCSTCHTPRGFLMQEVSAHYLGGAQVGPWYAPNITSDATSGIGSWSKDELVRYLATGSLPGKAQAAGSMGRPSSTASLTSRRKISRRYQPISKPWRRCMMRRMINRDLATGSRSHSLQACVGQTQSARIRTRKPAARSCFTAIVLPATRRLAKAAKTPIIRACSTIRRQAGPITTI
ncbi:cytochrome c [Rhizobium sp. RCAM05973]|uniref:c-type cytochrome n=1 Tax=Rhizobium sp. RCAM05973 TaxID=2994066 RepID=UPI0022EBCD66